MFKLGFGGGSEDDGGAEVFEDFGPEITMIPRDTTELVAPLNLAKPLGMGLSQAGWVEYVEPPEGQAGKAKVQPGTRVVRVETHGAWALCAGLPEVKSALADAHGRGDLEVTLVLSGMLAGELKWNGGCLGVADECIYCVPANALEVLRVDPKAGTLSTFGHLPAFDPVVGEVEDRWFGGVAAKNGHVYGAPFNGTQVLDINPETKMVSPCGDTLLYGRRKWRGAVLCQFGRMHCVPCDASSILCFEPKTGRSFTFGDVSADGSNKWHGGVFCSHDERIWCVPFDSDKVLAIDPELRSISYMFDGQLPEMGSGKWAGAVVGPDKCIYCIPFNATCVLKLDPHKRTASAIGHFPGHGKWSGGVLGADGCVYGMPHRSPHLLRIDPKGSEGEGEAVLVGKPLHSAKGRPNQWRGGCAGPNGDVFGVPADATSVLHLRTQAFAASLEAEAREEAEAAAAEKEAEEAETRKTGSR